MEAGDGVPGAVVAIDEDGAGMLAQGVGQNDLGLDQFVIGRLAILAFLFEAVLDHADHGIVLIRGHHGQGAVVVADALQTAQFAGRQMKAQEASDAEWKHDFQTWNEPRVKNFFRVYDRESF